MGFIVAADPASRVNTQFFNMESLANAMTNYGFIPIRPDGTPYVVQQFEGGLIFDGAPLNVYFDEVWYQGQQELVGPHWGKDVPVPPPSIQALPVVPMPDTVTAQYQAYKASNAGISTPVLLGVAAIGYLLLRK